MDRITKSFLVDFSNEQQINESDEAKLFEKFASYCVLAKEYNENFEVQDVCVGDGGDCGIDGLGIIANGRLINTKEEVDDLIEINGSLSEVVFILIQAKTSRKFDGGDIGTFGFGVLDFFSEEPKLVRNEFIQDKSCVVEYLIEKSPYLKKKPICRLYYVTTGTWCDDTNLLGRINAIKQDLSELGMFSEVEFSPVDAEKIQKFYRDTKDKVSVEISFENRVLLPEIEGITEAYLGTITVDEFYKLITDDNGKIRKSVFYDNVRDYQGDNPVNKEISETLESDNSNRLVVLNNGVTIVSKFISTMRNKFTLEDFQIVNGCQTSHVLYNYKDVIDKTISLPIKLIITDQDDIINNIIKATNRQTEVKEEELIALTEFHKKLESFYKTFDENEKLFYERRSKQYNSSSGVEKVRIVTISSQLRTFASMFLDQPHLASRFYGKLVKDLVNKMFLEDHELLPYYTSAYALYKLEYFFRNKSLDIKYRKFRYHMLMMFKYRLLGSKLSFLNSKKINDLCDKVNSILYDNDKALLVFKELASIIDNVVGDLSDTETTKRQSLNEVLIKDIKVSHKKTLSTIS